MFLMEGAASVHPGLGRAHVHIFVKSCGGLRGEGVVFSTPDALPLTTAFYAADLIGLPKQGLTATTNVGIGGLFDVPVGIITVEARVELTGQLIARVPVNVREHLMTLLVLAPGPS
jgi:hypothetical protein